MGREYEIFSSGEVSAEGSWGRTALHPAITLCMCRSTMRYPAIRFAEWARVSGTVAARPGSAGHLREL
ncbi:hypothetical protein GCM10017687_88950 [Streptomyces echinatus]|uniref:Uncharacterized protein n=1 Tax=Streptomyces echinatus TaxID=67293 RepID=A0A7W9PXS7_9ACTN|nr:hypothetical protein [Streptomyces echinatus]